MVDKDEIREHVRQIKDYYTNLVVYGAIVLACIIIWMSTGGGFWPIWVIVGFGLAATLQGLRLGVFPAVQDYFPFMRPEWEEEQVKKLSESHTTAPKATSRSKKAD